MDTFIKDRGKRMIPLLEEAYKNMTHDDLMVSAYQLMYIAPEKLTNWMYGHIVFEDLNLGRDNIEFCIKNSVETDYVLNIYEQYADFLTLDDHHIWAARNYIKLQKNENAEKAIMRCVKIWKPTENFTVLPMKFFLFKDIAAFLTPKMKLEILSTKKNIQ